MSNHYPHHDAMLPAMNRVGGQVEGIKRMVSEGRSCTDILTQLRAVRAAIRRIEAEVLETHLKNCVSEAILSGDRDDTEAKIEEIKALFKRYEE